MKAIIHISQHNHYLSAENIIKHKINDTDNIQLIELVGPGEFTHSEHNTIHTTDRFVIKYTQQELDPITNQFIDIYD